MNLFANNNSVFIPPFEQSFNELKPFYIRLHSSLEEAIRLSLQYFKDLKTPVDVFLLNDLIRYHTKRFLKQQHAISLGEDYDIGDLSNNGLAGTYLGYSIRVLKAYKGYLPLANSGAKAAYFSQQLSFVFGEEFLLARRPNIIFVWDLSRTYVLNPMHMCCPQYAEKGRGILSVHYDEILPHPAEIIQAATEMTEETKDIEIRLKEETYDDKNIDDIWREDQASSGTEGSYSE